VVGKELKPKHLQEKVVTYFSICVGFRVRRATFQSEPQQAENLDSEERKSKRHEKTTKKTTKISKLRKSLERATRNKRQT